MAAASDAVTFWKYTDDEPVVDASLPALLWSYLPIIEPVSENDSDRARLAPPRETDTGELAPWWLDVEDDDEFVRVCE